MNMQEDRRGRVGKPIATPRPPIFELDVTEHVQKVAGIDPRDYFVTSGDAVAKARVLARDLRALGTVDGDMAASQADHLVDLLVEVRGADIFLETEFDPNHVLLCIPKNPRNKTDV